MKNIFLLFSLVILTIEGQAQTNPAITNWLINTTGLTGRHYVNGNPTPIIDAVYAILYENKNPKQIFNKLTELLD